MNISYIAAVYAYDTDGSVSASVNCWTTEQIMKFAAVYEKVKVAKDGQPPFWLKLKAAERAKYQPGRLTDDKPKQGCQHSVISTAKEPGSNRMTPRSSSFYDGLKWGKKQIW